MIDSRFRPEICRIDASGWQRGAEPATRPYLACQQTTHAILHIRTHVRKSILC
jgi:hypothetical protein